MNLYDTHGSLSLLTDLYELTMMQGYFFYRKDLKTVFDMVIRREPFGGGYMVFAGLEPLVRAVLGLRFTGDDLAYLAGLGLFKPAFLEYLREFRFRGDIYAAGEGEIVFPNEPVVRVHGTAMEAQLLESILLNIINSQTLIATKAARISGASGGKAILEFGLRKAPGVDGALSASRASFIGGVSATSNVLAGKTFGIPVKGTMAHSWIMSFSSEEDSFRKFSRLFPDTTILLVDTYDTLKTGLPAAIRVLKELRKKGSGSFGVRLDSGDLEYLSKRARSMLDRAGLREAKIVVSSELTENIIEELVRSDAPVDFFGVGTHIVAPEGDSALTGVYKLAARKERGSYVPAIKLSNDPGKITWPGIKNVMRFYAEDSPLGDLMFLEQERSALERGIAARRPVVLHHPAYAYAQVTLPRHSRGKALLMPVVREGKLLGEFPPLSALRSRAARNLAGLHPTYRRLLNPHLYKVGVTKKLRDMRATLAGKVKPK